jgi:hypothetical protein
MNDALLYHALLLPFVQMQMQMQIQIQIQIQIQQVSVVAVAGGGSTRMMTSSIHPSIHPSSHPAIHLSLKIHCYAFITVYVMAQMFKYQKIHESYSKSMMTFLPQRSSED